MVAVTFAFFLSSGPAFAASRRCRDRSLSRKIECFAAVVSSVATATDQRGGGGGRGGGFGDEREAREGRGGREGEGEEGSACGSRHRWGVFGRFRLR